MAESASYDPDSSQSIPVLTSDDESSRSEVPDEGADIRPDPGRNGSGTSSPETTLDSSGGETVSNSCSSVSASPSQSSLTGGSISNPFARSTPQPSWASETSDAKPILAPSKLGSAAGTDTGAYGSAKGVESSRQMSDIRGIRMAGNVFRSLPPPSRKGGEVSSSGAPSKPSFTLKPSVLTRITTSGNPFARVPVSPEDNSNSNPESSKDSDSHSGVFPDATCRAAPLPPADGDEGVSSSPDTTSSFNGRHFVPLSRHDENGGNELNVSHVNGISSSSSNLGPPVSGHIFGQSLHSRLVAEGTNSTAATNGDASTTTGNLFTEAASEICRGTEDGAWGSGGAANKSLVESSLEFAERENLQKRKFDQVEVITGEENESNVMQMNCKLYAWVNGCWQERGRGLLRLNDWSDAVGSKEMQSRLVIRTQGTLTVMLNTKVWAEMSVEKASSKSVRFTALETDGQPKIFLVMSCVKDVELLFNSLKWRVETLRAQLAMAEESCPSAVDIKKIKKV